MDATACNTLLERKSVIVEITFTTLKTYSTHLTMKSVIAETRYTTLKTYPTHLTIDMHAQGFDMDSVAIVLHSMVIISPRIPHSTLLALPPNQAISFVIL